MPFKRSFRRSFHKKGKKRRFRKASFKKVAENRADAVVNGPSILKFSSSFLRKQPLPDRFFTWVFIKQQGKQGGNVATYSFNAALSILNAPFGQTAGTGNNVPTPLVANTARPAGLNNLLYNSVTNTGIWNNYRVWRAIVEADICPSNSGDQLNVAGAPVVGTTLAYANAVYTSQGPNGVSKDVQLSTPLKDRILRHDVSIPAMIGLSSIGYQSWGGVERTYSSTMGANDVSMQYTWETALQANTTGAVVYNIGIAFFVEFFGRQDVDLLD